MTARSDGALMAGLQLPTVLRAGWLGSAALGAALVAVLFLPNGWLQVGLAALATLLLATDRRLGPLPAAMLVLLAIPVGRGSEVGLPYIGENPVRPHDAVVAIGLLLGLGSAVLQVRRDGWRTRASVSAVPVAVFLAVGVGALLVGIVENNALRDVARDVRWWVLYAAGLLALISGTSRPAVIRALVWGMTLYAALVLLGMLMPDFEGGLKIGAYAYDPRMRLHYGQVPMLIPAAAFATMRATQRPIPWLAVAALLAAAAGLTITRALMASIVLVVILVATWAIWRRSSARAGVRAALATILVAVMGLGAGVGAYVIGIQIWAPPPDAPAGQTGSRAGPNPESRPVINAVNRITGSDHDSLEAQAGGRFYSYADAFLESRDAPVIGHGLGEMVRVGWAYGGYKSSTVGLQPAVDNAYLTVAIKAGAVGVAALGAMLLWPLRLLIAAPRRRYWLWLAPAWLALLGLTLIESFAVSGYAPYALGLLLVLPALGAARQRAS